jgi:hypothetical protein
MLAGGQQPLRQRTPNTVRALDRPGPIRPGLRVRAHRREGGPVSSEPTRPEQQLALVDDLDGGRQLVGIDPDDDVLALLHVLLPPMLVPVWTARLGSATTSRAVPS